MQHVVLSADHTPLVSAICISNFLRHSTTSVTIGVCRITAGTESKPWQQVSAVCRAADAVLAGGSICQQQLSLSTHIAGFSP